MDTDISGICTQGLNVREFFSLMKKMVPHDLMRVQITKYRCTFFTLCTFFNPPDPMVDAGTTICVLVRAQFSHARLNFNAINVSEP